jgi:hypothetical protein
MPPVREVGLPGGDQSDIIAAPCVDNHQDSPRCVGSQGDVPLLQGIRLIIDDRDGKWVVEHHGCIGKTNPVLGKIAFQLPEIPDHRHNSVYNDMHASIKFPAAPERPCRPVRKGKRASIPTAKPIHQITPHKALGLIGKAPAQEFRAWRNALGRSIFDKPTWRKPAQVWQDDCFMGIESVSAFNGTLGLGAI